MLPADGHVHTQFSWDAPTGDMHATCARAAALGLPALAFTEHVDLTTWNTHHRPLPANYRGHLDEHGRFLADPLQLDAYLHEVDRCRHAVPDLRIWTGAELSEAHWHPAAVTDLVDRAAARGGLDRLVGSVHALPDLHPAAEHVEHVEHVEPGEHVEVGDAYTQRTALDVVRAYLTEVAAMAASDAPFEVLGHIDYPLRHWPAAAGPLPWAQLEDDVRAALEVLAASGRALEVNTRRPLEALVVRWWHQAGGQSVVFGSDAHRPEDVARDFADTTAMVAAHGFRPRRTAYEHWGRA